MPKELPNDMKKALLKMLMMSMFTKDGPQIEGKAMKVERDGQEIEEIPMQDALKDIMSKMLKGENPEIMMSEGSMEQLQQAIKDGVFESSDSKEEEGEYTIVPEPTEEDFRKYKDYEAKEIGDIVRLNDIFLTAYLIDYETGVQTCRNDEDPERKYKALFYEDAIVVDKDEDFRYNCGHCDKPHPANLVLYFTKSKLKFRALDDDVHLMIKN